MSLSLRPILPKPAQAGTIDPSLILLQRPVGTPIKPVPVDTARFHEPKQGASYPERMPIKDEDLKGFDLKNMSEKDLRRARNAISARRCRAKRLGRIKELEERVNELETEKALLLERVKTLQSSVSVSNVVWFPVFPSAPFN